MKRWIYAAARILLRGVTRLLGGVKVQGAEIVPADGPVLLVANHLCDADPPILWMTMPRNAWYMAMRELFDYPIIGPLVRYGGAFPVTRDSADRAALKFAEERLKEGEAVVVFPEGRGNPEGVMQPFQKGAALLALRSGARIVPVGIVGTHGMLTYGTWLPRRASHPVEVRYGPPIPCDDLKGLPRSEAIELLTRRMEEAVAQLADQPLPAGDLTVASDTDDISTTVNSSSN